MKMDLNFLMLSWILFLVLGIGDVSLLENVACAVCALIATAVAFNVIIKEKKEEGNK